MSINIEQQLQYMSDYLSEIWSLDKQESNTFLLDMFKVVEVDYHDYISSSNVSKYGVDIIDNRRKQLEIEELYTVDALSNFGRDLLFSSMSLNDSTYNFEKTFNKAYAKNSNKKCFKGAKLKGWDKEFESELLEECEDSLNLPEFKGLRFSAPTHPTFAQAVLPINVAYADEKHNYGVKRILEWACVSHFIELIEARNILDLKKDIDNIVENFEEKHKDNLENAIFESHWEPKFESNVGKKISSELSKKAKNSLSREQFDKQVESITSLSLLSEDDKNKLVQENAKKIKEQLSEKLQKLKSPKP